MALTPLTVVISNVRGPPEIKFHGLTVTRLLGVVPTTANTELSALICSYNGKLNLELTVNATTLENPQEIIDEFTNEYKKLKELTFH
jgi:hypothetical protein